MKNLFGPVASRRLGLSLGIDLLQYKTCTMNCIYCECGETTHLTSDIREYVPTNEVISELNEYLSKGPDLDIITFSGSGEPTLHSKIGEIINFIQTNFPRYKISVLTNGTLLSLENVRRSILNVDIIIPSLDAVSEEIFQKIVRPIHGITAKKSIQNLIEFRKEYKGKIYLEIFMIPDINDTESELEKIKDACLNINPDKIQLNNLDRPGTEEWVKAETEKKLNYISTFLEPLNVEIIGKPKYNKKIINKKNIIIKNILSIIERRPSTIEDLSLTSGIKTPKLIKVIDYLLKNNIIETKDQDRGIFYKLKEKIK